MTIENYTFFTVELTPDNIFHKKQVTLRQGNDLAITKKDGSIIFGTVIDVLYHDSFKCEVIVFDRTTEKETASDGFVSENIADKVIAISDIEKVTDKSEEIASAHLNKMMIKLRKIQPQLEGMGYVAIIKTLALAELLYKGDYKRAWERFDAIISNKKMKVNISGNACEVTYEE